jgi:1,4-alpha-glucan branching enzyme
MIKRKPNPNGHVEVTFAVPDPDRPISVVADFNGWDPAAHPLRKRSNGTRSVKVALPKGSIVRFRYLDHSGEFFDDPEGDAHEPNGFGQTHTLLHV